MNALYKTKNFFFNRIFKMEQSFIKDFEEIDEFIKSFDEPKTLFDRSYYQYLCQKKQYKDAILYSISYEALNLVSLIALVVLMLIPKPLYLLFSPIKERDTNVCAIAAFSKTLEDRIPAELKYEFDNILYLESKSLLLTNKEKDFILELWKAHPFSCNFVLKNTLKVGMYRHVMEKCNNISAIICSCEYSYTSSILTEYCRRQNISHINIMHGEIFAELSKTFVEFDRFYVWDEYYARLCVDRMRASENQFSVAVPNCLLFDNVMKNESIECKYYFQDHTKKQILEVKRILEKISYNYKVRPHPLYTNMADVVSVFDEDRIEKSNTPISQSIMETKKIIAWDSTVLLQAFLNGKKTIIDDVTNASRYNYSIEAGYIMANKSERLSEMIGKG